MRWEGEEPRSRTLWPLFEKGFAVFCASPGARKDEGETGPFASLASAARWLIDADADGL
jgi:hypothetical protein